MTRIILTGLVLLLVPTFGWIVPASAQDDDPTESEERKSKAFIQRAARMLERLPEVRREEIKRELLQRETSQERVRLLRRILREELDNQNQAPDQAIPLIDDLLRLSPDEQQRLFRNFQRSFMQGFQDWSGLTPKDRQRMMGHALQLVQRLQNLEKVPGSPEEWQKVLSEEGLAWLRSLPLQDQMRILQEFQRLRQLDPTRLAPEEDEEGSDNEENRRDLELPPWAEELQGYAEEAGRLYEAWQSMPEESRQQLVNDLAEGARIYFEDNVQPEIEREIANLRVEALKAIERVERFRQLPREERRQEILRRLESLAKRAQRRFGGEEESEFEFEFEFREKEEEGDGD